MVKLYIRKNVVYLGKHQEDYEQFVNKFLVKYESVTKIDYYNSTRSKKRFKTVKERRDLFNEDSKFIIFSRGLLEVIPSSEYIIADESQDSLVVPILSSEEIRKTLTCFDLRDDQVVAVSKCLYAKRGVIQLPTAVGKSAIIASTIKRLHEVNPSMHSLVLAPTLSTVNNINDTLKSNQIDTEVFGHPNKTISSPVTTSLVQSLVSLKEEQPELLYGVNAVFYDECLPYNSKILLSDGSYMEIGQIYKNNSVNEVLSYDFNKCEVVPRKILRKFKTPFEDRFWKVYYEHPLTHEVLGVTATSNHKIWTKEKGYVQVKDLSLDLHIKIDIPQIRYFRAASETTYVKIKRISPNVGSRASYKYNLEIEDTHNYFANNVLVSNCHHLKCETWNKLNSMLPNVEYSLGFSALSIDKSEIYAKDIRDISYDSSLIIGSSGRVIMHMDPSYAIEKGIIALPVIFRVNHHDPLPSNIDQSDWHKVVKLGLMSTSRTDKISKIASMFSKNHRKVLILVSEKDYAFRLCQFLVNYGITDFGVSFGAGSGFLFGSTHYTEDGDMSIDYVKEESLKVLDKLSTGEISVLIATSHLDEGADVSGLDACILASGGKKDRRLIQRVGRVLRKSKSGKYAYVIDFTDTGSSVLSRQSKARLNMYKKDIGVPEDNIFENIDIDTVGSKFKELEGLI